MLAELAFRMLLDVIERHHGASSQKPNKRKRKEAFFRLLFPIKSNSFVCLCYYVTKRRCHCKVSDRKRQVVNIAQYPVLSALHFTSLTDLFTQTPSRLLWEMLHLMCESCSYTYPPLSTARYACVQLSEQEQCRVKKLAQCYNIAAQGSNQGSLPLSDCTLQ